MDIWVMMDRWRALVDAGDGQNMTHDSGGNGADDADDAVWQFENRCVT